MSQMSEREIARRLAERDDVEPPAGLLERIQSEIPAEIRIAPEVQAGREERIGDMSTRQRWLIAASVVAAIGAGVFALQLRPPMEEMEGEETVAEVPRAEPQKEAAVPERAAPMQDAGAPKPLPEAPAGETDQALRRREQRMDQTLPPPPPSPLLLHRQAAPRPAAPAQPMEMHEMDFEGGVEGGVVGGVAGGVVGGTPGGVVYNEQVDRLPPQ
ncbi:MAG TPA: hypothetical protein VMW27_19655, partial [Thermoanaerobaculia bacterium]|nr:hypothetical protein [Thermoanaerobaculia bacterium]